MHKWQLYEAKNKLSSLIDEAVHGEPQCIMRNGKETVVVVSIKDYQALKKPRKSFEEFLLTIPKSDELVIERAVGKVRGVNL